MGLASLLFGQTNPFSQYVDQNHNWISSIGAGIAQGPTIEQGLANAARLGPAAQLVDAETRKAAEADKQRQQQINQTAQWVRQNFPQFGSLPPDQGFQLAMQAMGRTPKEPVDPTSTYQGRLQAGQDQGLTGNELATYALTGNLPGDRNNSKFGNTPVMATDGKGNWIAVQPGSDGTTNQMQFPSGFHPDPGGLAGTKTTATVDAKTAAAARAALPGAQQAFDLANKAADALLTDTAGQADQFGNFLGIPNQIMPVARPGSDMARFRTELAQGQGNAFLQARQVLKGAGQVTDYEGAKAESAYSRMALAAQQNNQQEFVAAVQDFKQAVAEGYQKLQDAANGDYKQGGSGVTGPAPTSGQVDYKTKYGLD